MYIARQIKSLIEAAKVTGKDQWINVKETRDKIKEYINTKKEFSVDEIVGMVHLMDTDVMKHDRMVKDLRFELYFNPSSSDKIFKQMEELFKGHVMVKVTNTPDGKFIIDQMSNPA